MGNIVSRKVVGFNDENIAKVLKDAVLTGKLGLPYSEKSAPADIRQPSTRIFIGTAKTEITASTGGDVGVDFTPGSGTAYIGELDTVSGDILWMYESDGTTQLEKTVYHLSDESIDIDAGVAFLISQDVNGNLWVIPSSFSNTATGTGTGTGTDDVCISEIGRYRLDELAISGNPSYVLGIDETGCMVLVPVGDCDE